MADYYLITCTSVTILNPKYCMFSASSNVLIVLDNPNPVVPCPRHFTGFLTHLIQLTRPLHRVCLVQEKQCSNRHR